MKIHLQKSIAIFVAFLLLLSFSGCSKKDEISVDSKPVINADVVINDAPESEPEESTSSIPVHVKVEKITLSKYSVTLMQGQSDMPIVTMHPRTQPTREKLGLVTTLLLQLLTLMEK